MKCRLLFSSVLLISICNAQFLVYDANEPVKALSQWTFTSSSIGVQSTTYENDQKVITASMPTFNATDVQLCGRNIEIQKDQQYELTFSAKPEPGYGHWPLTVEIGGSFGRGTQLYVSGLLATQKNSTFAFPFTATEDYSFSEMCFYLGGNILLPTVLTIEDIAITKLA